MWKSKLLVLLGITLLGVVAQPSVAPAARPAVLGLSGAEIERAAPRSSAEMRSTVATLAGRAYRGRDNDTPESLRVQSFLIRRLRQIGSGLNARELGDRAYKQSFDLNGQRGTNLLALIRGRELPNEYVIVGAHYDHLDTRSAAGGQCSSRGQRGGEICNGATDNATGVAEVLEVGRALRRLPRPPRRSVILALWDSEEDGLVGSLSYVSQPLVPLADTAAYINLDIQGQDLLPSMRRISFAIGAETGGAELQRLVGRATGRESARVGIQPLSYLFGQARSDYVSFGGNSIPIVFFSDATGPCYHTVGDDLAIVNFTKLLGQVRAVYRIAVNLAEQPTRLAFVPPNPAQIVYDDAVVLARVLGTGIADLAMFTPVQQSSLRGIVASLDAIVSDGAPAFGPEDVGVVANVALQTLEYISTLECRPW